MSASTNSIIAHLLSLIVSKSRADSFLISSISSFVKESSGVSGLKSASASASLFLISLTSARFIPKDSSIFLIIYTLGCNISEL